MPDLFVSDHGKTSHGAANEKPSASAHHTPDKRSASKLKKKLSQDLTHIPEDADRHSLPGHSHSPLAAYCFYPDQVKFINEDQGEKIVLFLRKHPLTNIPWVAVAFIMLIMPFFFSVFSFVAGMPWGMQIIIFLSWYLITAAFMLEKFLGWFFNVDLITDERILDINFVSLMYREITEANLDEIQEVTFKPATGIYSFFDFGDVLIQTAAEVPRIVFKSVPKPQKVAKVLRELGIQEDIEELEGRIR